MFATLDKTKQNVLTKSSYFAVVMPTTIRLAELPFLYMPTYLHTHIVYVCYLTKLSVAAVTRIDLLRCLLY